MKSLPLPWLLVVALWGCSQEPARAPNPVRPIDEPRAVRIIANAIRDAGKMPIAPRSIQLEGGDSLQIDVGVSGRQLGVAYVTDSDRKTMKGLGSPTSPDDLLVMHGIGPDIETRVLIMRAENYMSDDNTVGDQREASTVTAENRISRDVRDFLVQAESAKWP
ncbi:MAG TPA: hypothetical protein VL137_08430 [Polyangiaceae bacterium]|nr:hypothetical protein [Polyangiaceae bacterium]